MLRLLQIVQQVFLVLAQISQTVVVGLQLLEKLEDGLLEGICRQHRCQVKGEVPLLLLLKGPSHGEQVVSRHIQGLTCFFSGVSTVILEVVSRPVVYVFLVIVSVHIEELHQPHVYVILF